LKNFIGIFYAQGGSEYMDWGIPMWFIPCIFVVFLFRCAAQSIRNKALSWMLLALIVITGFIWPYVSGWNLPWSLNVAAVALGFYVAGEKLKKLLIDISLVHAVLLFVLLLACSIFSFNLNPEKVDMYRSVYGNDLLFFVSGLAGSVAVVLFFKLVPVFTFLSYLGRHTIVLLATHIRMLTLIKSVAFFIFGITVFNFTEAEKLFLSVAQVIMAVPIIWFVNKYVPILDGKIKKT
jgi:fucose 4-O-acetylase-like acetyltransferase